MKTVAFVPRLAIPRTGPGWLPSETEELVTQSEFKMWIALASTGAGVAGLAVAWLVYSVGVLNPKRVRAFLEPLPEILENKYYLDALYEGVIVRGVILGGTGRFLALWDRYVVDGVVNGVGQLTRWSGDQVKYAQSGQAQVYASVLVLGTVGAVAGILLVS